MFKPLYYTWNWGNSLKLFRWPGQILLPGACATPGGHGRGAFRRLWVNSRESDRSQHGIFLRRRTRRWGSADPRAASQRRHGWFQPAPVNRTARRDWARRRERYCLIPRRRAGVPEEKRAGDGHDGAGDRGRDWWQWY